MQTRRETTPDLKPRIFISAVSKEFAELRRRTDDWVRQLGCEPETMEVGGTEPGDLRARPARRCQPALALYRRALEVRERLLAANPDSAQPRAMSWSRTSSSPDSARERVTSR